MNDWTDDSNAGELGMIPSPCSHLYIPPALLILLKPPTNILYVQGLSSEGPPNGGRPPDSRTRKDGTEKYV